MPTEYNPLDYANLTKACVTELMSRKPKPLGAIPDAPFAGSGVYALFYQGTFAPYETLRSPEATHPIYVGKAVPTGARKGLGGGDSAGQALWNRLREHHGSINSAGSTLHVSDFLVRYLVVTPLWITMSERFLIEHYGPVWNVCIDGFGNHDPGAGRRQGEISWWDALHPGRAWAHKQQQTRTAAQAMERLAFYLQEAGERNVTAAGADEED